MSKITLFYLLCISFGLATFSASYYSVTRFEPMSWFAICFLVLGVIFTYLFVGEK